MVTKLFENAPVTEVVVEVLWSLQPIVSSPGASIDPFYQVITDPLAAKMESAGFGTTVRRIPEGAPLELFGHQAATMYRSGSDMWPLFQHGPGVFTANTVPPYEGWSVFAKFLKQGLDIFGSSHAVAAAITPTNVRLRYLNIFSQSHGVRNQAAFLRDNLGLDLKLPDAIRSHFMQLRSNVSYAGEISVPIENTDGLFGFLNWRTAVDAPTGQPLVSLDLGAVFTFPYPQVSWDVEGIMDKVEKCHYVTSEWFSSLVSGDLREKLGEVGP